MTIASADTVYIRLDNPIPLYVLYRTAMANRDGTFGFRRDVYLRDEGLAAVLRDDALSDFAFTADMGCPVPG